ncbi:MAG: oligosaccharide flippase family protein [Desulfuromonadales bacterium]
MKKALLGVTAANFAAAGFGFLSTVLLARLLDVASFGRISFIISLVTIFSSIADFGFSPTVVIYYNQQQSKIGAQSFSAVNTLFLVFLGAFALLSLPVLAGIMNYYDMNITEVLVVFVVFLFYCVQRYSTVLHQAAGNWRGFTLLTCGANVARLLILAGAAGGAWWWRGQIGYTDLLAGLVIQAVVVGSSTLLMSKRYFSGFGKVSRQERQKIYTTLIPLGCTAIVIVVCMRFDSLVIQKYLGAGELGIYAVANTLAFAFPVITGSLMNVLLREASQMKDELLPRMMAVQKKFLPWMLFVLATTLLVSSPLITLLFGDHYKEAASIFRILLIPYLGGVFFTPLESYFYAREPMTILRLKSIQMLIIVIGSMTLIVPFRLYGVVTAILISRLVAWVFLYSKSTRIVTIQDATG